MRKRILGIFITVLVSICFMSACSSSGFRLKPKDMLDNETGEIYSLDMPKEAFDEAFPEPAPKEDGDTVVYLDDILEITFEDGKASEISCDGSSNRFSFYEFDFGMDISEIEKKYKKNDEVSGYIFYERYCTQNGKDVSLHDSDVCLSLMVRDGDLVNMKDGEYRNYTIRNKKPPELMSESQSKEDEKVEKLVEKAFQYTNASTSVLVKEGKVSIGVELDALKTVYLSALSGDETSIESWEKFVSGAVDTCNTLEDKISQYGDYTIWVAFYDSSDEPYIMIDHGEVEFDLLDLDLKLQNP